MNSDKKVAIGTGAGTGIGKACALGLVEAGYQVAFAGRNLERLERVLEEAGLGPEQAIAVGTDVGDEESVQQLFDRTVTAFGRLDLLFNNAGAGAPPLPLEDRKAKHWPAVVNTNLAGAALCTQGAVRSRENRRPPRGRSRKDR